jgi:hypothetical protein
MLESVEQGLFWAATALYVVAWGWHFAGWKRGSVEYTGTAVGILWAGWLLHLGMVGLRWYRAEHVPMLSEFEFVTFFALLVFGCFLLFAVREQNRMLGVFLVPVGLILMAYAAFMPKDIEPELSIFKGFLLRLCRLGRDLCRVDLLSVPRAQGGQEPGPVRPHGLPGRVLRVRVPDAQHHHGRAMG